MVINEARLLEAVGKENTRRDSLFVAVNATIPGDVFQ
jgi:hypothetical protein